MTDRLETTWEPKNQGYHLEKLKEQQFGYLTFLFALVTNVRSVIFINLSCISFCNSNTVDMKPFSTLVTVDHQSVIRKQNGINSNEIQEQTE